MKTICIGQIPQEHTRYLFDQGIAKLRELVTADRVGEYGGGTDNGVYPGIIARRLRYPLPDARQIQCLAVRCIIPGGTPAEGGVI